MKSPPDDKSNASDHIAKADAHEKVTQFEQLASDFSELVRLGRPIAIEPYVIAHPDLADEIRDLFPVILAMEQSKQDREADSLRRQIPNEFEFDRLGDYRIVREIGRGGMGVVFEARRESDNERVAVKWFPWRTSAMSRWKERFEQEAKTVAMLRHPNIVPLLGTGEDDGNSYYVMQYIDGVSLDWVLHRLQETGSLLFEAEIERHRQSLDSAASPATPVSSEKTSGVSKVGKPKTASESFDDQDDSSSGSQAHRGLRRNSWRLFARIAVQVGRALAHAHRQGVLHNDIKPGNLLLDRTGRVWVTDFGLARPLDPPDSQEWRTVAGTLRYMAPERFGGWFDELSDLYSLGMTLYELVTRHPAFEASDRSAMIKKITEIGPIPPRQIDSQIPYDLETIILKAICRNPDDRYYSLEAFVADLLRFIKGERPRAKRPTRLRRWWNRLCKRWFGS